MDAPVPVPLHFRRSGHGSRPMVLVHGWGGDLSYWDAALGYLSDGYQAVAVDLRGSGDSPKPPSGYRFAHHEADLLALTGELDLPRFALVGHSRGGAFSLHFALAHPERLSCVVVVDSGASVAGNTFIEQFARRVQDHGLTQEELTEVVRKWFVRIPESRLAHFVNVAMRSPPAALAETLLGLVERDMRDELHHLDVPALVMYGEHDRNRTRAEAEWLRDGIPNARLHVFPGVAHCPQVEVPAAFMRVLADFLEREARWG